MKDWRNKFDILFVADDGLMGKYSWYKADPMAMGPNRTQESIKIFIEELLEDIEIEHQKELAEAYKGRLK